MSLQMLAASLGCQADEVDQIRRAEALGRALPMLRAARVDIQSLRQAVTAAPSYNESVRLINAACEPLRRHAGSVPAIVPA